MILRPGDYRDCWPRIRAGLERILDEVGADWRPEDVYAELKAGRAALFFVGDDGFIVLQRGTTLDGRNEMFVLAVEGAGMLKHYPAVYEELEDLARKAGCSRLRHVSKHSQWEGRFWTLTGHVYEHEVKKHD